MRYWLDVPPVPVGVRFAKAPIATEDVRIAFLEGPVIAALDDGMTERHRRAPGSIAESLRRRQFERHGNDQCNRRQYYAHRLHPLRFPRDTNTDPG